MHNARLHADLAAIGHRIARVHDEVHDHLVELPPVDADRQKRRIMVERQLDLLPHQRLSRCIRSAIVSRRSTTSSFSFCCRENARSWPTSDAARLAFWLIWMRSPKSGSPWSWRKQQQVAMARDGRQQVVEVMRHAAGKFAHGLHFLALHELLFKALEFGRVVQNRQQGRARRIGDPAERDLQEALVAAPAARTISERVGIRSATVSATQSRIGRPSPSTSVDRCPYHGARSPEASAPAGWRPAPRRPGRDMQRRHRQHLERARRDGGGGRFGQVRHGVDLAPAIAADRTIGTTSTSVSPERIRVRRPGTSG
jgi:hypothetical protein